MRRCLIPLAGLLIATQPGAATAKDVNLTIARTGEPEIVFDAPVNGCAPIDMPDINARAYRDAKGQMVVFALHYVNRPLRGPDLGHLKIDCKIALDSGGDPDPAHYNDRNYITATWTRDGEHVSALVHHEYHADAHDRCTVKDSLGCWYNTILAYRSEDGGASFSRDKPAVVAAAPFTQEIEQGRHRGFFNPSNMFSDGRYVYTFIATTGWAGQDSGACLFRSENPADPDAWRAWDGKGFSIHYKDPYAGKLDLPTSCAPIAPFRFPVGAVVRHRTTGTWVAVFQSAAGADTPVDGFYTTTSRNLLDWTPPRLLLAGHTLYSDLCQAGPEIIAYPSLIDPAAKNRNFDDTGDSPDLVWAQMDVKNCATGRRLLLRQQLKIEAIVHER